jgi:hypothetical protein
MKSARQQIADLSSESDYSDHDNPFNDILISKRLADQNSFKIDKTLLKEDMK